MNKKTWKEFIGFAVRVIIIHILTYLLFGLIMSNLFNYREIFQREIIRDFMLPLDAHTPLGILFQPVRGLLFALALWPLRDLFLAKKHGWLMVWGLFLVFGILSTTGAAPCSIEGVLYTKLPLWYHLIGLPEITLQTLAFSTLLVWWEKRETTKIAEKQPKQQKGFLSDLLMAVVIGCFSYIGFAVGSLAIFFITTTFINTGTGTAVDFDTAAADIKNQLMFVVAFIFNVVFVLLIKEQWMKNKISLWAIFGIAWVLDSLTLFVYQSIFYGSSSLPIVFFIGFLPALIMALSIRQNFKKPAVS
jgi:hypothetical protein